MRFATKIKRKPEWTDSEYIKALEQEIAFAACTVPDYMLTDEEGCSGCEIFNELEDWPYASRCKSCYFWKEDR